MHTPATALIQWLTQPTIVDSAAMMLSTAIFWRMTGWAFLGKRPGAFCVFAVLFALAVMSVNLIITKALHYAPAKALWIVLLGVVWLYQVFAMIRDDLVQQSIIKSKT